MSEMSPEMRAYADGEITAVEYLTAIRERIRREVYADMIRSLPVDERVGIAALLKHLVGWHGGKKSHPIFLRLMGAEWARRLRRRHSR